MRFSELARCLPRQPWPSWCPARCRLSAECSVGARPPLRSAVEGPQCPLGANLQRNGRETNVAPASSNAPAPYFETHWSVTEAERKPCGELRPRVLGVVAFGGRRHVADATPADRTSLHDNSGRRRNGVLQRQSELEPMGARSDRPQHRRVGVTDGQRLVVNVPDHLRNVRLNHGLEG